MLPPSFAPCVSSLDPVMRKVGTSTAVPCCLRLTPSRMYVSLLPGPDQMRVLMRIWTIPTSQNQRGEEGPLWGPGAPGDSVQVSWELPSEEGGEGGRETGMEVGFWCSGRERGKDSQGLVGRGGS